MRVVVHQLPELGGVDSCDVHRQRAEGTLQGSLGQLAGVERLQLPDAMQGDSSCHRVDVPVHVAVDREAVAQNHLQTCTDAPKGLPQQHTRLQRGRKEGGRAVSSVELLCWSDASFIWWALIAARQGGDCWGQLLACQVHPGCSRLLQVLLPPGNSRVLDVDRLSCCQ